MWNNPTKVTPDLQKRIDQLREKIDDMSTTSRKRKRSLSKEDTGTKKAKRIYLTSGEKEQLMDDHLSCAICMDLIYPAYIFQCGHSTVCQDCWLKENIQKCPICQTDIVFIFRNYSLESITEKFFSSHEKVINFKTKIDIPHDKEMTRLLAKYQAKNEAARLKLDQNSRRELDEMIQETLNYFTDREDYQAEVSCFITPANRQTGHSRTDTLYRQAIQQLGYEIELIDNDNRPKWKVTYKDEDQN